MQLQPITEAQSVYILPPLKYIDGGGIVAYFSCLPGSVWSTYLILIMCMSIRSHRSDVATGCISVLLLTNLLFIFIIDSL